MRAAVRDGWVVVPYTGHDLATVEIAVGDRDTWTPAFLDWNGPERVAKIRPPASSDRQVAVWLRVGDVVTSAGRVTLSA
ncbi:hypothetical protein AB0J37_02100 [Microbispora rosea]|uniref:hypothetical protein n=1 Tax=Microbispora rosea TaxID=58117 RepID=UPI00341A5758